MVTSLFLTAAAAAQSVAAQPAEAAPRAVVPIAIHDNRVLVPVSGPGFAGRLFLLDSGAAATHFSSGLAAEAGLAAGAEVGVAGLAPEGVIGRVTAGALLDIGGAPLAVPRAVTLPEASLLVAGRALDGVIGRDLFEAYAVEIDYEGRRLVLHDRAAVAPPSGAERLPLRVVGGKPYVIAALDLAGDEPPQAAELQLDTGFGGAVGIDAAFAEESGLVARIGPTLPSAIDAIGGRAPARLGRLEALRLGAIVLPQPFATIALARGAGTRAGAAGRIGGALLRQFTLLIDQAGGAAYLAPNARFGRILEIDMSGLALSAAAAVRVERVVPGSAAEAAGIVAGDLLIGVDGRLAAELPLDAIRASLMRAGETRRLRLLRGTTMFEAVLPLRRRI